MTRPANRRSAPRSPYTAGFYDQIRPGVQTSAAAVVPIVLRTVQPRPTKVIDVGCGEGWWAHTFAEAGCEVIGVDGGHVGSQVLGDRFLPHDLTLPLPEHLHGRFDVAVCLEVGEHLPAGCADTLIGGLARVAPVVLFSAAIPGQGGVGHVNEAWPVYWTARFHNAGMEVSGALRWQVWGNPQVEPWYQQNLLVAARHPERMPDLFDVPHAYPWPVVHPTIYDWRRQ